MAASIGDKEAMPPSRECHSSEVVIYCSGTSADGPKSCNGRRNPPVKEHLILEASE